MSWQHCCCIVGCYSSVRLTSFQRTQSFFFLFFLSYQINIRQPRCLYASLFFSHHAACTPHSFHLHAVHGYALLLFFHSATAVRLPHASLPFHFMAVLDARFYLMLLESGIFQNSYRQIRYQHVHTIVVVYKGASPSQRTPVQFSWFSTPQTPLERSCPTPVTGQYISIFDSLVHP